MTVVEISAPGGPEVLRPAVRRVPVPMAGEILIRVRAAGVNRPDLQQRAGAYPPPPGASDLPGLEAAGEVAARRSRRARAGSVGDAVCALLARRRLRRVRADPRRRRCRSRAASTGPGGGAARDLLHRLGQRLRPRPARGGRELPRPRRRLGHRHHRDPARRRARRPGLRHRGLARRSAPPAARSAPSARSTTAPRISSPRCARRPAGAGST